MVFALHTNYHIIYTVVLPTMELGIICHSAFIGLKVFNSTFRLL